MKGPRYSRAELERVFDLYPSVSGAIHERNPKIIQLAASMNRGIRSVENQLLMFRAYERQVRGEGYGRSNWNALIPEIYDEKMSVVKTVNMLYPEGFKQFQKSQKSAVSRLSDIVDDQSPLGRIRTPLHDFLDRCLDDNSVLEKKSIIALVGGAGNGKTNSLGFVLEKLRERHSLFTEDAQVDEAIRSSSEETGGYFATLQEGDFQLSFIQDATSRWVTKDREILSTEESLNESLKRAFISSKGILVICINRGIIASLLSRSQGDVKLLLEVIDRQTSVDSYIRNESNMHALCGYTNGEIETSSYPLDKMRLFGQSKVHHGVCNAILTQSWQSEVSRRNFESVIHSIGSLFSALELSRNGLVTFRDYMHFLHLLFTPLGKEEWLDLAPVRLWFGSGLESEYIEKAGQLKQLSNSRIVSGLRELQALRKSDPVIHDFDQFDPLRIHNLLSADNVQQFISDFKDGEIRPQQEFSLGDRRLTLPESYHVLFESLKEDDIALDWDPHQKTADKFKLKRLVFSLFAQGLSFLLFEQANVFFRGEDLAKFERIEDDQELVALLKDAIGFKQRSDGSIASFDYGLTNELWASDRTSSVLENVKVQLSPELIVNTHKLKPNMAAKILRFSKDGEDRIEVIIDFTKYCVLRQTGEQQELYAESLPTWFAIWINTIKGKMATVSKRSGETIKVFGNKVDVTEIEF